MLFFSSNCWPKEMAAAGGVGRSRARRSGGEQFTVPCQIDARVESREIGAKGKEWGVLVTPVGAPLAAGGGGGTTSLIPGGLAALGLGIQRGKTEGVEGFKREGTGATNSNEIMSDLDKQHGRIRSLEVEGL